MLSLNVNQKTASQNACQRCSSSTVMNKSKFSKRFTQMFLSYKQTGNVYQISLKSDVCYAPKDFVA